MSCAGSVMVSGLEREIGDASSNSGWVHYIHVYRNTLGKSMNPYVKPLPPGLNSRVDSFLLP